MAIILLLKILSFLFIQNNQTDSVAGFYQLLNDWERGGYRRTTLKLNKDSTFQFHIFIDEICYTRDLKASGTFSIKDDQLKLAIADSLMPKLNIHPVENNYLYVEDNSGDFTFSIKDSSGINPKIKNIKGYHKIPFDAHFFKLSFFAPPHYLRCNFANIEINKHSKIEVENISMDIPYYIEHYDFTMRKNYLKGIYDLEGYNGRMTKQKLVLKKIKSKYSLPK